MRIAVVVCVYPPYRGGIGQAAQRQSELLRELGHEVEVFAPATGEARPGTDVVDGLVVHRLRALASYGNSALLPQLARDVRRYDAVYLHYPFFGGAEAVAAGAVLARIPYLVFFHMEVTGSGARGAFLRLYERTVGPLVLRGARAVLVSSYDYFRGSSAARHVPDVHVVPYGIDTQRYSPGPVPGEDLARLGLPRSVPLVAFVGGMDAPHSFKGIPELLCAFAAEGLRGRAHLALVGDGELRVGYERLADDLGVRASVTFLGRVDEADLIAVYRAAAVTTLPSTTREEAFGLVLIEAMACGSPVVATRLPGVREVVGEADGAGGILVPPGDAGALGASIASILDDRARRDELSAAALSRVRALYSRDAERERLRVLTEAHLGPDARSRRTEVT